MPEISSLQDPTRLVAQAFEVAETLERRSYRDQVLAELMARTGQGEADLELQYAAMAFAGVGRASEALETAERTSDWPPNLRRNVLCSLGRVGLDYLDDAKDDGVTRDMVLASAVADDQMDRPGHIPEETKRIEDPALRFVIALRALRTAPSVDSEEAQIAMEKAIAYANAMETDFGRFNALSQLLIIRAQPDIIASLERIEDPTSRNRFYNYLAVIHRDETYIEKISSRHERAIAYASLVPLVADEDERKRLVDKAIQMVDDESSMIPPPILNRIATRAQHAYATEQVLALGREHFREAGVRYKLMSLLSECLDLPGDNGTCEAELMSLQPGVSYTKKVIINRGDLDAAVALDGSNAQEALLRIAAKSSIDEAGFRHAVQMLAPFNIGTQWRGNGLAIADNIARLNDTSLLQFLDGDNEMYVKAAATMASTYENTEALAKMLAKMSTREPDSLHGNDILNAFLMVGSLLGKLVGKGQRDGITFGTTRYVVKVPLAV
jgi:hypothetical protein